MHGSRHVARIKRRSWFAAAAVVMICLADEAETILKFRKEVKAAPCKDWPVYLSVLKELFTMALTFQFSLAYIK